MSDNKPEDPRCRRANPASKTGHKPGAKPSVENIGVLFDARRSAMPERRSKKRFLSDGGSSLQLARNLPRGHAMAPPKLARTYDQSRMFSIQLKNVLFNFSGTKTMRPPLTASAELFAASGLVLRRTHWVENASGSTMVPQRSALADGERVRLDLFHEPELFEIGHHSLTGREAIETGVGAGFWRSCGASSPITFTCGRLWRLPASRSLGS